VRLRDIDGYVHTVPFGEITVLTNMMRDFGYAVIDVGVAYKENTDEVLEVIRQVDAEAREDADFAERLAGDIEIMGVNALGDSAVTLRVRVRTVAGYQWGVRREYLRRIKLKFDEVGIEIPFPHMTVWFGEMKGDKLPPVAHVRVEAETVGPRADEPQEEPPPAGDAPSPETSALSPPGEVDRS
jgi:small conductance mechanosensitive channel